jgi:hypothetical protein
MTRLPVAFAEDLPPVRRDWTTGRVVVWMMLFASFSLWIGAAFVR